MKNSGIGRETYKSMVDAYTQMKNIYIDTNEKKYRTLQLRRLLYEKVLKKIIAIPHKLQESQYISSKILTYLIK